MEVDDSSDEADLQYLLSLDDDQDSDDDDIAVLLPCLLRNVHRRSSSLFRKRWDSSYLVNLAVNEGSFISEYRLDPGGFDVLHQILGSSLERDEKFSDLSRSRSGSANITTASRLGAALIMLGGGRRIEAMRTHGLSMPTVYDNFHRVIDAINSHPALDIVCDNSISELQRRSLQFMERSTHELFKYCTGAIDGLAITIRAPSNSEVQNQSRFYSGSKKKYCLNMQGVCDARCRFIAVTCKHVGSTNDAVAYVQGSLKELCERQQFPYHWNGDNAYTLSESMMIPFPGSNLSVSDPCKEWFNFWHSQLRITIERTFGIFIQRWGIFWQPLKYTLPHCVKIVHACCRLHNFCISRNLPIIATHLIPNNVSNIDVSGRLVDNVWRVNTAPTDNWGSENTGNTLRQEIVHRVDTNHFAHERNYK
jgi:DDE superfamily endonuclease